MGIFLFVILLWKILVIIDCCGTARRLYHLIPPLAALFYCPQTRFGIRMELLARHRPRPWDRHGTSPFLPMTAIWRLLRMDWGLSWFGILVKLLPVPAPPITGTII